MVTSTDNFILAEFQFYTEECDDKYMKDLSKAKKNNIKAECTCTFTENGV